MTDLEITRLCAQAMGLRYDGVAPTGNGRTIWIRPDGNAQHYMYNPLGDDAQCFALVKRFNMRINHTRGIPEKWGVYSRIDYGDTTINDDLNRAICECVAKMELSKTGGAADDTKEK